VTRWGLVLLVAYLVIGLTNGEGRRALRYVVGLTVVVLAYVSVRNGSL
jgi:hypothetical protein